LNNLTTKSYSKWVAFFILIDKKEMDAERNES